MSFGDSKEKNLSFKQQEMKGNKSVWGLCLEVTELSFHD